VFPVIADAEHWLQDYVDGRQLDSDVVRLVDEIDALMVSFTDVLVRVAASSEGLRTASLPAA